MASVFSAALVEAQKKSFFGKAAPSGYVAGAGRGATGFTTRSDIGPARAPGEVEIEEASPFARRRAAEEDKEKDGNLNDAHYDEENGYSGSLFASAPYEEDDKEADAIYDAIDRRMDTRRDARREKKMQEEIDRFNQEHPKIQQQFVELKRGLNQMSAEDWEMLPEAGSLRAKKPRLVRPERYTPVPDSVINAARTAGETTTAVDPMQGMATPGDLTQIGEARTSILNARLNQASDSVTGQTVVDAKGYMTDLNSVIPQKGSDYGDLNKARTLLANVTQTNPRHAPGWIAAARLEEAAGKMAAARTLAMKGCEFCPKSEDMWVEAARLHPPDLAKAVVAQAVEQIPHSVKIWLKASDIETDTTAKKRVLRKALEHIPNSVRLWKTAVELETPEDARILLGRAVECCPDSVDLWLALAHLETYDNAKAVLNKARMSIPTDRQIWIAAAQLEEANSADGNRVMVDKIVQRAIKALSANGVQIVRDDWLADAQVCEKANSIATAKSIVMNVIDVGVEAEDRRVTWADDAATFVSQNCINCARAVYEHALEKFSSKQSLWKSAALLEKQHGTPATVHAVLEKAVRYCPQAEELWLMGAKEQWRAGNIEQSKQILMYAFNANPNSEEIWLAAVKLESETSEFARARALLDRARANAPTARVWMKSAKLEWQLNELERAKTLLAEGVQLFPEFDKLHMMRGQILMQQGDENGAREAYKEGIRRCTSSIPLWLLAARLEEQTGNLTKARGILERARFKNQKNDTLWLEAVRVETRSGNAAAAQALMAKAMQECPTSGLLLAEAIFMEPVPLRRAKSLTAVQRNEDSPHVLVAVAKLLWAERKVEKAAEWFRRAIGADPDLGDAWATFYKFQLQHGTANDQQDVLQKCVAAEPRHGEHWTRVSKSIENWNKPTAELLQLVSALAV
ncbi:pre-mRNA splicing factor [Capsaspora owczarzaki ATCC 30864]|uniref:Pre-mRNA splicing factor n=1 Tax=Capsaspora owczarzaki (strain ATCC 30864) TaxID=595528 RepID=A0A0D2VWP0_CAPO3|nr:pre-mRNA splicing factor [Capsaspora owczarzaki ATCC 30864]KJE95997.1 pre-mRNA splicing factor [Capsaspora owczarzaki ATCC 30864]|eukprot:XP_004345122.1 pre-mRNA splicing factor [Capsaspora owczarzaki ATCC 30864]